jgi:hypothetical protein
MHAATCSLPVRRECSLPCAPTGGTLHKLLHTAQLQRSKKAVTGAHEGGDEKQLYGPDVAHLEHAKPRRAQPLLHHTTSKRFEMERRMGGGRSGEIRRTFP